MKKILSVLTSIMLVLSSVLLISCGNKVETIAVYGQFFNVQEAYDNGLLTFYDCEYIMENYKTPENFVVLDEIDKDSILHDYKQFHPTSSDEIEIENFGSYNGCTAVRITDKYYGNAFDPIPENMRYSIVDEKKQRILKCPAYFWWLRIWKEYETPVKVEKPQSPFGAFYSLQKAFDNGFLTKSELSLIVDEKCEKDQEQWSATREKIKSDYILLDIGAENHFVNYLDFLEIIYIGNIDRNVVIRIDDTIHRDELMEFIKKYDFNIDGIKFTDTMPFKIVWRPLDI